PAMNTRGGSELPRKAATFAIDSVILRPPGSARFSATSSVTHSAGMVMPSAAPIRQDSKFSGVAASASAARARLIAIRVAETKRRFGTRQQERQTTHFRQESRNGARMSLRRRGKLQ